MHTTRDFLNRCVFNITLLEEYSSYTFPVTTQMITEKDIRQGFIDAGYPEIGEDKYKYNDAISIIVRNTGRAMIATIGPQIDNTELFITTVVAEASAFSAEIQEEIQNAADMLM